MRKVYFESRVIWHFKFSPKSFSKVLMRLLYQTFHKVVSLESKKKGLSKTLGRISCSTQSPKLFGVVENPQL